jgi:PucR C-terminal helix-turn-helix domain/GGDEF-like domain
VGIPQEPALPDPAIHDYDHVVAQAPEPTVTRLRRSTGPLAAQALRRMDDRLPWYRAMTAEDRSWVGLVAQAAIAAFIAWYDSPEGSVQITADVFGTAPRELTRSVSLHQTLEMVRTMVDVVEETVGELAAPGDEQHLREAVLRYSRDVAFAAAEVYARAAETRGAWDARLEALVVDALVRGEVDDGMRSRSAALGWPESDEVAVVAGMTPPGAVDDLVEGIRRHARSVEGDALVGVQGDRLVVVVGLKHDPLSMVPDLVRRFGDGPVVTGPVVPTLTDAARSARAALAGLVAAAAWPAAPRPVDADDLLPERLLSGDDTAGRLLVERGYRRLAEGPPSLLETVATYLDLGRSLEGAARALFVHPNTVRYRLRRVADITGWDPTDPRDGFVLQVAITAGRLTDAPGRVTPT